MAEGVGFEPTRACALPVFKTGAINHSTTPPRRNGPLFVTRFRAGGKVVRQARRGRHHFGGASPWTAKCFRLKPGGKVRLKYAYVIKCQDLIKDSSGSIQRPMRSRGS